MRRKFWLSSGGGGVDKDREVAEDELAGESMEAAEAVLDRSETEMGELFPSPPPLGSMFSFSSFTSSK